MKKVVLFLLVLICSASIIFAGGKKENADNVAENSTEVVVTSVEEKTSGEPAKDSVSAESAGAAVKNDASTAEVAKAPKAKKGASTEYSFNAETLTAGADKESIVAGTALDADGYFKTEGTVTKRINSEGKVTSVEVGKAASSAIVFSVNGKAEAVIEVSSNGGSNTSAVGIIDGSGAIVPNAEGVSTVSGTKRQTLSYSLGAGTYKLVSPLDNANKRGARVFSVKVKESGASASKAAKDYLWDFRFFGVSVGSDRNYLVSAAKGVEGDVKLSSATFKADGSINKKGGKFVADSPADGGSYYYTVIDPAKTNFRLQADVYIDAINPTPDGQEGFALMVRDSLGEQGVSGNWMSNLVSVCGTKLPSPETAATIGVRAYTGIHTAEASDANEIKATRLGWYKDADDNLKKMKAGETYRVCLEKTDYAYIVSQYDIETGAEIGSYTYYIPAKDINATSVQSYKELNDPLTYQEGDKAYVSLVVARGLNATFKNISFETSDWDAEGWHPQPTAYQDLSAEILSSATAPKGKYNLVFRTNADGKADVYVNGRMACEGIEVSAGVQAKAEVNLKKKTNNVKIVFTPNPEFKFSVYEKLSSYEAKSFDIDVSVKNIGGKNAVYVSPEGISGNNGRSAKSPVDVLTAFNYVSPGQTILLESGVYDLSDETILVQRGRNGSADKPITVTVKDGGFATLDFGRTGGGVKIWGDYWNLSKINITGTKFGAHGMQLGGSHCALERVNFFNNGTSGLTVSGDSKDGREFWPAYNLVKNCTSVNNADKALEDADGFCAKLTTGEGNVFDGCIAAYNADDGWDLFAKVSTGQIGAVTIKNSVTYKNGYLMVKEGGTTKKFEYADVYCDENGTLTFGEAVEMKAGNGNGFKMGGSSLPGGHILMNSISYENKAKGFDSNSCPDIKIYDSTSYNNESYNVAMYTGNKGATTGFEASGVLSFRSGKAANIGENIALQGQNNSVAFGASNYYWNTNAKKSENSIGEKVSEDWFVNLDTSRAPERRTDGSIDMHGLLLLKDEARSEYASGARGYAWGQTEATLWVVGDSTVSPFNDKYYLPREGYGEELAKYLNVKVYNLARSGASSLDFIGMDNYKTLMEGSTSVPALGNAETENFLIIGFGHNDEKTEALRYTNPNGSYKTKGSFANCLYENYVKPAFERGVTPVLCTPIARLTNANTPESYETESGHKTSDVTVGGVLFEGGDYAQAIIDMVKTLQSEGNKIEYIDLTSATIKENVALGSGAAYLHAFTGAKYAADGVSLIASGLDQTHTNVYGAKMNAWLISTLAKDTAPSLYAYSLNKEKPTYEAFFGASVNKDYEVIRYNTPSEADMSAVSWPAFTDADGKVWRGTVFGDVGGANKITDKNFSALISGDKDKPEITLTVANNSGKIASGSDGLLFYYIPLPAGTKFTLSAKAKIVNFAANNQVSFGLMTRDDLYIDQYVAITMGDYVACGSRNQGNIVNFGRKSSALVGEAPESAISLEKGTEVDLKITGTKDGYTLAYGDIVSSAGFDYPLTAVDSDMMYVGFYVVRNCSVTFSDVHLDIVK